MIAINEFVSDWSRSAFGSIDLEPWEATNNAPGLIQAMLASLSGDYRIAGNIAVHRSATVESGATIKGPAIIGENCLVASAAYLRGGVFLDKGCVVGPACELKTTYMFAGSKVAHLSFVGDSIIGARANIEAGAIVANHRNEMDEKQIRFIWRGSVIDTGREKFGALIGDDVMIGANSVVAPGAILEPGFKLDRLCKVDQHPDRR